MRRLCLFLIAMLIVLLFSPRLGEAEDGRKKARELASKAIALSEQAQGDKAKLGEAIALFQEAFALDPRPHYQCSIGIAYQQSDNLPLAHSYYTRCIGRTADAARKSQLREYQAAIEKELRERGFVPVDLASRPAGALVAVQSLGASEQFATPVQLWLASGSHIVSVTLRGFAEQSLEVQVKDKAVARTVELVAKEVSDTPAEDKPASSVDSIPATGHDSGAPQSDEPNELSEPATAVDRAGSSAESPRPRLLGWSMVGASAATAVGSVYFLTRALDARDTIADTDPHGATYSDLRSKVRRNEVLSYSFAGVAVTCAALGGYWLLRSGDAQDGRLVIAPDLGGRGAFVSWSMLR